MLTEVKPLTVLLSSRGRFIFLKITELPDIYQSCQYQKILIKIAYKQNKKWQGCNIKSLRLRKHKYIYFVKCINKGVYNLLLPISNYPLIGYIHADAPSLIYVTTDLNHIKA